MLVLTASVRIAPAHPRAFPTVTFVHPTAMDGGSAVFAWSKKRPCTSFQHLSQGLEVTLDLLFEVFQLIQYLQRWVVFYFFVFDLLVAVDREIVFIGRDIGLVDNEGLLFLIGEVF